MPEAAAASPNATGATMLVATAMAKAPSRFFFLKEPSPKDI
jgi:hypothetical protein